ncbi:MAG: hypothetical protein P8165_07920 [Deltaproteobacteria bacterium]|jgi:DNA-binding beta-propeller fold protein YncE
MKLRRLKFYLGIIVIFFAVAATADAGVNMDLQKQLTLEDAPIDVVATPDGKYLFVLTDRGNVAVFDEKGIFQNKIHLGNEVDQLEMGPKGGRLYVTSRSGKTIRIISLDFFEEINTKGAPYKGPANAPVTIAVFSDFQ